MTERAKKLRQQAADHVEAAERSFERCDTDGFLSQWAHGLRAQQLRTQAEIEEDGGLAPFPGLFDQDGQRVDAKLINGQYGRVWLLATEAAARYGRRFIPYDGSHDDGLDGRSRVQVRLGLVQRYELAPAKAIITGSGTGLSGSAWVTVIRVDGK